MSFDSHDSLQSTIIIVILQLRKLRLKEVKWLIVTH